MRTRKGNSHTASVRALLLLCVFGVITAAIPARAADRPMDSTITGWVQNALREDPRVPSADVTVVTTDGIVKLTGTVRNLAARKYADLEAQKIRGVRGVLNELTVNASFRYDFDIAQDILRRILNSAWIQTRSIDAVVSAGNVVLSGQVPTWAESQQAELLASETDGVRSVKNNIVVVYPKSRSDADIRKDVEASLARDTYLGGVPIAVSVKSGVVTLTGSVGTAYEKERAGDDAMWVWNVKKVDDHLEIKPWESEGARARIPIPGDQQLQQAVRDELYQDLRLEPFRIKVEARSGDVTLRGSVPTFYQKRIAEKDADDVLGTAWVTNLLDVTDVTRSDKAIRDDVMFELEADYAVDMDFVTPKVKDGVVTLTGEVNSPWERMHAQDVVTGIDGVRRVVNDITVFYSGKFTDASIHDRIRNALAANAETQWVSDNIQVTVMDGKVTLTGTVNFWSEFDAAEDVAYNTDGVWEVDNNLHVRDYDYDWVPFARP